MAMLVENFGLFSYFCEIPSLVERKRIVKGEMEYLEAKMVDIRREISSIEVRQGKKRKVDDYGWMEEGDRLVKKAKLNLDPVGWSTSFFMGVKVRWDLYNLGRAINHHSKKGDLLLKRVLYDVGGPSPGYHLPVKPAVGELAFRTLGRLKFFIEGNEVGRIVIHGIKGIGKTFFMKHLHNHALNTFDYVFWLSFPVEISITSLQNAIAEVLKCDFASDDDIVVRARKLSDKFSDLGSYAFFLDGIPKADFSLTEVGIPVPGRNCKLVIATNSTFRWSRMFHSFEKVEIERLPDEDAYELFMREANIREGSVSSLGGVPRSLSDTCDGVPRVIMNLANRMCGIDDPREWRCALFEVREVGK